MPRKSPPTTVSITPETLQEAQRGRPPLPPAVQMGPEFVGKTPEHIAEEERTVHGAMDSYTEERDLMNQMWGQIQMADAISKLTTVVSLQKLAHIKEAKLYKALRGKRAVDKDGEEIADVGNWDGFCAAIGSSRQKVDEDLMNLAVFGEEALAQLTAVGAGYRELRKLRKLPEDERKAITQAQDKESLLELIDDLAAKHAQEKADLEKQAQEAQENYAALDKVEKQTRDRLSELEREHAKMLSVTDMWDTQLLGVSDEIHKLGLVADEIFGKHVSFIDVCEVVADKLDPDAPDYRDKLEQARVPIARLGDQIERFAHIVARLRFDFGNRVGCYLDKSYVLTPEDVE